METTASMAALGYASALMFCNTNIFPISDNPHPTLPLEGGGLGGGELLP